jgi:cytochrome bd-I ubiquinol oxidase subunit X
MWYFSWALGLGLAAAFSILNALWLEVSPGDLDAVDEPEPRAVAGRAAATVQRLEE